MDAITKVQSPIYSVPSVEYLTFEDILDFCKDRHIEFIDLKFIDMPGVWQHYTLVINQLTEDLFTLGVGFDGSSIRGFQKIHESDMLLRADINTAFVDPFMDASTISFICNIVDPIKRVVYSRDSRFVAQKAENHLQRTGIADTAYFGPELEFYIFDDVRFGQTYNRGFYQIDSNEGFWNTDRDEKPNLGYKVRFKEGYFPAPPMDSLQNLRSKMVEVMLSCGMNVELHHHEVGTAGQAEIDMKYTTLVDMADNVMKYKYITKNVAHRYGKTVTFMPKPIFMDNGSGMHVHVSLWKEMENIFFEYGRYGNISQSAEYFIGGLIKHIGSVLAFTSPTTNSYRRLVPGYEAPINLIYSQRNRSACVRIPMYLESALAKRIEFRPPDCSCNPYLAFSAVLMAGLDGIENKILPPEPIDKDLYELEEEEARKIKSTPGSLEEVIDALEKDHDFLLKGDVFTEDLIGTYIEYKRKKEIDQIRLRPHPWEYALYYDI
jgi:glutamine synthetase